MKFKNLIITAIIIILVLLVVLNGYYGAKAIKEKAILEKEVVVHFLDVGQGDSAIVQSAFANLMIDCGTPESVDDVLRYMERIGIEKLDYLILTHPHSDHIGGAAEVLTKYNVETVILPNAESTSYLFDEVLKIIEEKDINVKEGKAGEAFALGQIMIDILAPCSADYKELNNSSIVTKITYSDVSFLFTGDAEILSEAEMLENNEEILTSTVLKVGHHGSSTSSSDAFLNAVSPKVAIYSCGKNNEYGHPHFEVVSRIDDIGAKAYRTYESGNIRIITDGKSYDIKTEK